MNKQIKVDGKAVVLSVVEDLVAVRFREPAPHSRRKQAVAHSEIGQFEDRYEVPYEKFTVFKISPTSAPPQQRLESAMGVLNSERDIEQVAPVFKVGDAYAVATDRLMVGFESVTGARKILKDLGCSIIEQRDSEFLVSIDPGKDPFDVVEKLDKKAQVAYAEPDFVNFGSHVVLPEREAGAQDPFAPDQYAIEITKAREAWGLQRGNPAIRIAILDEGVDTSHEDLATAIVGTYDAADNDTYQDPKRWDAHGTACAGLAAAIHSNGKGVMGIGGGCSLMGVRIAYSEWEGAGWTTRNSWIARAIDWCWENGADILSNSWGGGAPSTAITRAFRRAQRDGRNGKGCVVIIAAGNANSLHDYPGNLDDVLTVSASNEWDEPKTPTSRDGEHWWGSNFGPKIDVAAPGVHNYTTDNSGTAGYVKLPGPQGNYTPDFNGTSSSTPIVAGVAGLVLSANPDLTEAEVRALIRDTADKVGPLPYDSDGRNDRMGHGRVNALRAVQGALGRTDDSIPTGQHAPVSNIATDSESEMQGRMVHAPSLGTANTAEARVTNGLESSGLAKRVATQSAGPIQAPDTSDLRNIAEASFDSSSFGPEAVLGVDERRRVNRTSDYPWRVHASLLMTARDGSRWIGTGWFISPNTLITAGHCVFIHSPDMPERHGWVSRIEVMPGRNGDDLPFGLVTSEVFHSVVGWTSDRDQQYDYGAITIPTALGSEVGALGYGALGKTELLGSRAHLAGYPGDKPDGTQWYGSKHVSRVTSRKVFYDIDTAGGQSGAAVYKLENGVRTAFAIHAYGGATANSATRITAPVFRNFQIWSQNDG